MAFDIEQGRLRDEKGLDFEQRLKASGDALLVLSATVQQLLAFRAEVVANADDLYIAEDLPKVDLRLGEVRAAIDEWYTDLPGG